MIHIIFGNAAAGSLKHALRKTKDQVIGFPIDFSVGPIENIHKESGIENYYAWLEETFNEFWGFSKDERNDYQAAIQSLLEINAGEEITIWTSEDASEQMGLRISCYLLKDKKVDLQLVNTFDAMNDYMMDSEIQIEIRHSGECATEHLLHFYKHASIPVSEQMKITFENDGEELLKNKSMVRNWQDGKIVDDVVTRNDAFIMKCIEKSNENSPTEFILAARIIGEVLGHTEYRISDAWIEHRIRSLIDSGKLEYEGVIHSMRGYKIRVARE